MDELDALRKKRFEELRRVQGQSIQSEMQEQVQLQRQVEQLEGVVKQFLEKDALVRYGNIKTADPEKAIQILAVLANAIQQGQLPRALTDEEFKAILGRLTPPKKDFKISRK